MNSEANVDTKNPVISVLLPTNKSGAYFREAVQSILNQTFSDFELLVISNGDHRAIEDDIASFNDYRIKIIRTDIQQLCFALNLGIEVAAGGYIARMDSDDVSAPTRLEQQFNFMCNNTSVDVLGTQYQRISETGELIGAPSNLPIDSKKIKSRIYFGTNLCHPSILAKKSSLLASSGYFGDYAEDYDLWIRMLNKGYRLLNHSESLVNYRIHTNQMTGNNKAFTNFVKVANIKLRYLFLHKDPMYAVGILYDLAFLIYRQLRRN